MEILIEKFYNKKDDKRKEVIQWQQKCVYVMHQVQQGTYTSGTPVQLYLTIYSRDTMVESSSSVSRILTAREILNTVKKAN